MSENTFITTFERHLRVGEPKRAEILAELRDHITEDGAEQLGDPKRLAEKYNRVHIGFFHRPWRLYLFPTIAFTFIGLLREMLYELFKRDVLRGGAPEFAPAHVSTLPIDIVMLASCIGVVTWTLAKTYHSKHTLFRLAVAALIGQVFAEAVVSIVVVALGLSTMSVVFWHWGGGRSEYLYLFPLSVMLNAILLSVLTFFTSQFLLRWKRRKRSDSLPN